MTLEQLISLQEAIRKALAATHNGPTPIVRQYLQLHYPEVIRANGLTIGNKGLDAIIRDERKLVNPHKPEHNGNLRQICLDFGLPHMLPLDEQISIPEDPGDLIYGRCSWTESEDASINEADLHIILLDAQTASTSEKAQNWRTFRKYAAQVVKFRSDIPFRILSAVARQQIKLKRDLVPDEVQNFLSRVTKDETRGKARFTEEQIRDGAVWKLSPEEMDRLWK